MERVIEYYSGIGGLHLALQQSGTDATVVRAFDWDPASSEVYSANWGNGVVQRRDISTLTASDLVPLKATAWLLSPSCQPYTVLNPVAKGHEDPRARSFLHLITSVLPELCRAGEQPRRMLVENVAGFETSTTRQTLLQTLHAHGYTTLELLLTPLQFKIPNSRLRYYLLAKLKPLSFLHVPSGEEDRVWRWIPGQGDDPRSVETAELVDDTVRPLSDYLDLIPNGEPAVSHLFTVPDRILEKWGRLFDIVSPSTKRSCCFTRGYTKLVEGSGSILQMNETLDTSAIFDEFAAQAALSSASGDTSNPPIKILYPLGLRYFTPAELLRIFHFLPPTPEQANLRPFIWPEKMSTKTKYKLIGNSVNVKVVSELLKYLFI
ncbi:hypothetical protein BOTBODRAFT_105344 [Botryobasidium botryosum FD-172 SS1]|uniref:tRNA (cytosine(38)-C(5))-methyltransferase n=1 Tax=Botryobasidium botryosum (strain FD-172 SS1) TaxID=930990 RepID=A0A067N1P2_BOTB1|nr:hypothetical protein BOTBODRAFT_105344 [Botryobasidium botryosum FD-172 SS1]